MAGYGLLGQLPPGARGWAMGEQMQQNREANQFAQMQGLLGLQHAMRQQQMAEQTQPLQLELLRAQVEKAKNPMDWDIAERFNPQTGRKEKVIYNKRNPSQVIPFGGQEARNLSFQNTGGAIVGLDPITGQPMTGVATSATPHQQWQQQTKFPWEQSVDTARLGNEGARIGMDRARLYYDTGMGPMGGGAGLPRPAPVPGGMPQPAPTPTLGVPPPRGAAPTAQNIVPTGAPMAGGLPLPPRERAKLEADRPQAKLALDNAITGLDQMKTLSEQLLKAPLGRITGVVGALPNLPGSAASDAQANLETLKVKVGFAALQAMRDASKTGGALGQISEKEGAWLQNSLVALQQAQSEGQLRQHLAEIVKHIDGLKGRMQDAYGTTYGETPQRRRTDAANDPLGLR